MPSPLRSPKALFDWLDPGYFRESRWLRRTVRWLSWGAVVAGAVLVALTLWPGRRSIYQAGPLSPAHRMFNDDCARCHTEPFEVTRRLSPAQAALHTVPDEVCEQCHEGALHNEQQDHTPACAGCHREHRGAESLAANVADSHCTACHRDLHRKDGQTAQFQNVDSFAGDHPEFGLWRGEPPTDPGHVHFNHKVHLQPDGVRAPRGRTVKLECTSCHQPGPDRRYPEPINYERHCAECHPLSVQVLGDTGDKGAQAAAEQFRKTPAPHRPPAEVRAALRERFLQFVHDHPTILAAKAESPSGRPIPGSHPASAPPTGDSAGWVDYQLRETERALFDGPGGCRHCHVSAGVTPAARRPEDLPQYQPSNLLARWYPHSRFDHDAHRMLTCTECHAATDSTTAADVLLPRIETCRRCHNPQAGVRSDCVDCHVYHHREREAGWQGKFRIPDVLGPFPPRGK
jgi:hypothetical protein